MCAVRISLLSLIYGKICLIESIENANVYSLKLFQWYVISYYHSEDWISHRYLIFVSVWSLAQLHGPQVPMTYDKSL